MGGIKEIMNGTPLPNWAKLVMFGAGLGILIGVNQASVQSLKLSQAETTKAVNELRVEMRDKLVGRTEFALLITQVDSQARRLDILEQHAFGISGGRNGK